ncbi:MAG TPA: nickel transporter [Steroidobacteraceae bacterium]|nr:nickel transporter [Steroidobacteraceae bacterium]
MKHGFDADHLACIDGLTRYNQRRRERFARYCGALFSLGHGSVVILIALSVSAARQQWQAPIWLQVVGEWTSIACLIVIGILNLRAVLRASASELLAPVGIKGRFFGGLSRASRPLTVMLVGAAFAISFDTLSQAAFFALTASAFGGLWHALALALLFGAGMVTTDAINGLWISRLMARADRMALIASRVMSLTVAGMSLLIAAFGVAGLLLPMVAHWSDERSLQVGLLVCAVMIASYACARCLAALGTAPAHVRPDA